MYVRCNWCLLGLGDDESENTKEYTLGHICDPGNPHVVKQARQSGVEPIAYVAGICGVSEQEVMDSWDSRWES
ncbi:MAG: hypothetical protein DDT29_02505 [Dehalococcoidia bacterium]|nr:hypothetical protein [Bacillota bacterium]